MEIDSDRSSKLGDQRSMKSLMPVLARPCPLCLPLAPASPKLHGQAATRRTCWSAGSYRPRSRGLATNRSEEHTSELQSLMRISYAVFCLKKKIKEEYNNHRDHSKNTCKKNHYHNKI